MIIIKSLEFSVQEHACQTPHRHTWHAVDRAGGSPRASVILDGDGNDGLVGSYPSIAAYIAAVHGLTVGNLDYSPDRGDTMVYEAEGASRWTFHRRGVRIEIVDIPRTVFRFDGVWAA